MKKWTKPEMETLNIEETFQNGKTHTTIDYEYTDNNGHLWSSWDDSTDKLS